MHIQRRKTGTKSNPLVTGLTVFCRNRFLPLSKRGKHLPIEAMMTLVVHLKQQKPQVFLKKKCSTLNSGLYDLLHVLFKKDIFLRFRGHSERILISYLKD